MHKSDLERISKSLRAIDMHSRDAAKVGFKVLEVSYSDNGSNSIILKCSVKKGTDCPDRERFMDLLRRQMSSWFTIEGVHYSSY